MLLINVLADLQLTMIIIWIAIFILGIIVELSTEQLVSIWFSGGAVVGLILAICSVEWYIQVLVTIFVSGALVVLTQYLLRRKKASESDIKTNVDSLVKEKILVTKTVSKDSNGQGKYRDVYWTLVSEDTILENDHAEIVEIKGNKLVVKKID